MQEAAQNYDKTQSGKRVRFNLPAAFHLNISIADDMCYDQQRLTMSKKNIKIILFGSTFRCASQISLKCLLHMNNIDNNMQCDEMSLFTSCNISQQIQYTVALIVGKHSTRLLLEQRRNLRQAGNSTGRSYQPVLRCAVSLAPSISHSEPNPES